MRSQTMRLDQVSPVVACIANEQYSLTHTARVTSICGAATRPQKALSAETSRWNVVAGHGIR